MNGVELAGYAVAVSLLIMMPGADFAVVLRSGIAGGRSAGSAAGLGIAAGLLLWTAAVALGLGALLAASATAYAVVKYAGVAFLLIMGALTLYSAVRRRGAPVEASPAPGGPAPAGQLGRRSAFVYGLLTNALNPKVAITFLALMPQFLPASPTPAQFLVLCTATVLLATIWFQVVATVVGAFRRLFARDAVRRVLEAVTGTVLLAFGAKLAAD